MAARISMFINTIDNIAIAEIIILSKSYSGLTPNSKNTIAILIIEKATVKFFNLFITILFINRAVQKIFKNGKLIILLLNETLRFLCDTLRINTL
jgi:hypothetical protein